MALLDIFRNLGEKMGKGMERNIGGLLGVDPETLTPAEREQARRLSQMAVFDALARGTTPFEGLRGASTTIGAQREQRQLKERQKAAEQELPRIAGRLFGGSMGAIESLEEGGAPIPLTSQYKVDPRAAMGRMITSQAGRDVAQMAPRLVQIAEEMTAPEDYTVQYVPNVGLVAVNKKNPKDVRVVQAEKPRAKEPSETFKILSPEEAKAMKLPEGVIYQQNTLTKKISPLEGAPVGLSDTDLRQYKTADLAIRNAKSNIQNLTDTLARVPAYKALAAEGRGELEGAYTLALGAVRELQNSGVLNVGEIPFLEKALRDPTSFAAIAASPIKRREIAGQIKTIMRLLDQKESNLRETYFPGQAPPQNETPPAAVPSVPRNPRRAPSAAARSRAQSYYGEGG